MLFLTLKIEKRDIVIELSDEFKIFLQDTDTSKKQRLISLIAKACLFVFPLQYSQYFILPEVTILVYNIKIFKTEGKILVVTGVQTVQSLKFSLLTFNDLFYRRKYSATH